MTNQPETEDRSYEDQYAGMGTYVDPTMPS